MSNFDFHEPFDDSIEEEGHSPSDRTAEALRAESHTIQGCVRTQAGGAEKTVSVLPSPGPVTIRTAFPVNGDTYEAAVLRQNGVLSEINGKTHFQASLTEAQIVELASTGWITLATDAGVRTQMDIYTNKRSDPGSPELAILPD